MNITVRWSDETNPGATDRRTDLVLAGVRGLETLRSTAESPRRGVSGSGEDALLPTTPAAIFAADVHPVAYIPLPDVAAGGREDYRGP